MAIPTSYQMQAAGGGRERYYRWRVEFLERQPDRLKIEGDWEETIKQALGKKRPLEVWPRPAGKKKRAKQGAE